MLAAKKAANILYRIYRGEISPPLERKVGYGVVTNDDDNMVIRIMNVAGSRTKCVGILTKVQLSSVESKHSRQ